MKKSKPPMVFFDFDNTITSLDVLDSVIGRFSIDQKWMVHEEAWKEGKIGSRQCLEAQLKSVRVTRSVLEEYVKQIPLDSFALKLFRTLRRKGIPFMIVSDSFTVIIRTILRHYGIHQAKVFANELKFEKDRLIPAFPFHSKNCRRRCAHCKKVHVLEHKDRTTIYVGDGLSDVCPALEADIVFAKDSLASHLEAEGKSHRAFCDLGDVCAFFERETKKSLMKAPAYV
ncbi:MAG: MtnX-like HAD-IB family phosphatase [Candidatus Omnitrophota bacterium]